MNFGILLVILCLNHTQETPGVAATNAHKRDLRSEAERLVKLKREAIENARQRAIANPNSGEAHFNLAEALVNGPSADADHEAIIHEYLKAIELKPDYAEAYFSLGVFYGYIGMYKQGYEALNKSIALRPNYAEGYCALGLAYLQEKFNNGRKLLRTEHESRSAIEAFKKAIEIKPDFGEAYNGLGQANYYLKEYKESLRTFKQSTLLNPNDILAHIGIGNVHIELGDKNAATQEYEELKRIASQLQKPTQENGVIPLPNLAAVSADILLKRIYERFGQ